ncbi:MAG: hypothetical protein KDD65_15225 [Bacteroidetes bacterium]|nr:hypothetical protein [Bacteroidota bacterium]
MALLSTLLLVSVPRASAQARLVDGFSFGVGVGLYAGDLDGNPSSSLPTFVGSGHLSAYAGIDRHLGGPVAMGLEVHYNRLRGTSEFVDGAHNVISGDLIARVTPTSFVGFFLGVGPSLIVSQYSRLSPAAVLDGEATEGSKFALTIPIGVIIQENVRLGLRFSASDLLDGKDSGSNNDVLGAIMIGYRFK